LWEIKKGLGTCLEAFGLLLPDKTYLTEIKKVVIAKAISLGRLPET